MRELNPLVSIDRLTLLLYTPSLQGEFRKYRSDMISGKYNYKNAVPIFDRFISEFQHEFKQHDPTALYVSHYRICDQIDVQAFPVYQIRHRIDSEDLDLDDLSPAEKIKVSELGYKVESSDSEFCIRLEFNPNNLDYEKCSSFFLALGSTFGNILNCDFSDFVRVNRLDIQLDFYEHLNPAFWHVNKKRKSSFFCGSSGIETVYFGTRNTDILWRLYNKKVEQQQKGNAVDLDNWWRLEFQSKKPFMIGCSLVPLYKHFSNLFTTYSGISSGDWSLDFLLYYMQHHGYMATLSRLPDSTKKRYSKILTEYYSEFDMEFFEYITTVFPPMWVKYIVQLFELFGGKKNFTSFSSIDMNPFELDYFSKVVKK